MTFIFIWIICIVDITATSGESQQALVEGAYATLGGSMELLERQIFGRTNGGGVDGWT